MGKVVWKEPPRSGFCAAKCILTALLVPLGRQHHLAQFLLLPLGTEFPPTSLAAQLSLMNFNIRASQGSALDILRSSSSPLPGNFLQFSSLQYHLRAHSSQIYTSRDSRLASTSTRVPAEHFKLIVAQPESLVPTPPQPVSPTHAWCSNLGISKDASSFVLLLHSWSITTFLPNLSPSRLLTNHQSLIHATKYVSACKTNRVTTSTELIV